MILNSSEFPKYFGKDVTPRQMKEQIMALLEGWNKDQAILSKSTERS